VRSLKQYQVLDTMGISLWENRLLSPWVCAKPLAHPRCLVLLSHSAQASKILKGMLSVLGLAQEEIIIAWPKVACSEDPVQTQAMLYSLSVWCPDTVLIMGKELANQLFEYKTVFVQATYHPDELENIPEKKPEAYQDLLKLKQYLSM